jgi:serine/threonine-protein kinase
MASYLSRLRDALRPEYELEREIASGGMGTVFLAHEVALDRRIAVKIVRPEQASAAATERFAREAVTLAGLDHPNIVKVFTVGERGGFHYYTMQYLEGETLAERMRRKSLKPEEVRRIGRDLLDALETAHGRDVIHRDIKPQNIFLMGGRAILVDFGIATASGPQTVAREGSDVVPGTPSYMPPEQRYGWEVRPQTDLYAVAMVLYEALTGRRWSWFLPDDVPDWSGVPRWTMLPALKRALEFEAASRWDDARAFRRAWWAARALKYRVRAALLTTAGLVAGGAAALLVRSPPAQAADLVIPPLRSRAPT